MSLQVSRAWVQTGFWTEKPQHCSLDSKLSTCPFYKQWSTQWFGRFYTGRHCWRNTRWEQWHWTPRPTPSPGYTPTPLWHSKVKNSQTTNKTAGVKHFNYEKSTSHEISSWNPFKLHYCPLLSLYPSGWYLHWWRENIVRVKHHWETDYYTGLRQWFSKSGAVPQQMYSIANEFPF